MVCFWPSVKVHPCFRSQRFNSLAVTFTVSKSAYRVKQHKSLVPPDPMR